MREKIELRKQVRALRDAASAEMRARWSAEICARAMAHPAYVRARTVHIFLSFQSEVDTRAIIEHVQASGRRVVVPVFLKDSDETPATQIDTLDLAAFDLGRWGMRTPKLRRDVLLDEIDLGFVPLLVWAPTHVPRIGLAFALQRVERLPIETHDQMLDEVLHDSFVRNPTFVIRRS